MIFWNWCHFSGSSTLSLSRRMCLVRPLQVKRHGFCSNSRNWINFASVWLDGAANEFAATSKINGKAPVNKPYGPRLFRAPGARRAFYCVGTRAVLRFSGYVRTHFFNNGERLNDETETKDQVNTEQHIKCHNRNMLFVCYVCWLYEHHVCELWFNCFVDMFAKLNGKWKNFSIFRSFFGVSVKRSERLFWLLLFGCFHKWRNGSRRKYIVPLEQQHKQFNALQGLVALMRAHQEGECVLSVAHFDFLTLCALKCDTHTRVQKGVRCDFLMTLYSVSLSIVKWIIYALHMPAMLKTHLKYDTC